MITKSKIFLNNLAKSAAICGLMLSPVIESDAMNRLSNLGKQFSRGLQQMPSTLRNGANKVKTFAESPLGEEVGAFLIGAGTATALAKTNQVKTTPLEEKIEKIERMLTHYLECMKDEKEDFQKRVQEKQKYVSREWEKLQEEENRLNNLDMFSKWSPEVSREKEEIKRKKELLVKELINEIENAADLKIEIVSPEDWLYVGQYLMKESKKRGIQQKK